MEYSIHWIEEHSGDVLGQVALARGVPHPFPPVMDIPAPSRLHLKKTHPNSTPLVTLRAGFMGRRTSTVDPLHTQHVETITHILSLDFTYVSFVWDSVFTFRYILSFRFESSTLWHQSCSWIPTLWRNILPPSSRTMVYPDSVGSMSFRSVVIHLQYYTVLQTKIPPVWTVTTPKTSKLYYMPSRLLCSLFSENQKYFSCHFCGFHWHAVA
jgi:hypothetical protein